MAVQIVRGGPQIEALILTNRADIGDAAGVWAWDLLEAARDRWRAAASPETFGRWLRQHEINFLAEAAITFLADRQRLIISTEILEVQ